VRRPTRNRDALEIFERAPEGMFRSGIDGRILAVNPAAAHMLGYETPEELMGNVADIRSLYVGPARTDEFIAEIETRGETRDFRFQMRRKDGSAIWVSVSAAGIRGDTGRLVAFEGTVTDVTERKVVEDAVAAVSAHLEPAMSVASLAEVLKDIVGFEHFSVTVLESGQCREVLCLGTPVEAVTCAGGPIAGTIFEELVGSGRPISVEQDGEGDRAFSLPSGVRSFLMLPLVDQGRVFASISVGFAEPLLPTQKVLDLLTSVATAAASGLRNALVFAEKEEVIDRLSEIEGLKSEFVGIVAHDLRSPVAALVGFAQVLNDMWDEFSDEEKRGIAQKLHRSAQRLGLFIDDILQVATIEAGELSVDMRPFDLTSVISSVADTLTEAQRSRLKVDIRGELRLLFGDEQRHWQVLSNLVANALKFSPEDGIVEIEIRVRGTGAVVSVRDHGAGIAIEDQVKLFQKFSRLEDARGKKGSGLGLYICKRLVESQGGRIWVESRPGHGATFSYTIPLA